MGTVGLNDVMEVVLRGKLFGQRIMNVLHYRCSIGAGADYDNVAVLFHTALTAGAGSLVSGLATMQTEEFVLEDITYQVIAPLRFYKIIKPENRIGDLGDGGLPPATTVQIVKQGLLSGKGLTGHFAFAGLTAPSQDNGELLPGALTAIQGDIANKLKQNVVTSTLTWVPIISPKKVGTQWNDLRSTYVIRELRTQIRRVLGRGI